MISVSALVMEKGVKRRRCGRGSAGVNGRCEKIGARLGSSSPMEDFCCSAGRMEKGRKEARREASEGPFGGGARGALEGFVVVSSALLEG